MFDNSIPDGQGGYKDRGGFWCSVEWWHQDAQRFAELFAKGMRVTVEGRAIMDRWPDRLKELRQKAVEIYVASDPDREGESIGWHILQAAGIKNYKRVAFKAITKSCISAELSSPRRLDLPKVASQECRRVIDRLVGYLVTPELRRVMGRPTTAGRVQSVAVYLVEWWAGRGRRDFGHQLFRLAISGATGLDSIS